MSGTDISQSATSRDKNMCEIFIFSLVLELKNAGAAVLLKEKGLREDRGAARVQRWMLRVAGLKAQSVAGKSAVKNIGVVLSLQAVLRRVVTFVISR